MCVWWLECVRVGQCECVCLCGRRFLTPTPHDHTFILQPLSLSHCCQSILIAVATVKSITASLSHGRHMFTCTSASVCVKCLSRILRWPWECSRNKMRTEPAAAAQSEGRSWRGEGGDSFTMINSWTTSVRVATPYKHTPQRRITHHSVSQGINCTRGDYQSFSRLSVTKGKSHSWLALITSSTSLSMLPHTEWWLVRLLHIRWPTSYTHIPPRGNTSFRCCSLTPLWHFPAE